MTSLTPRLELSQRWHIWLPYMTLVVAVFMAYANVFQNGFLFDDDLIIIMNEHLRQWDFTRLMTSSTTNGAHIAGGFYRPMQMLLYYIVYQLFGTSIIAFHLLNVSLHAINACLMYRLGQKLRFSSLACFWGTLFWLLHPIHTEAITYMSATADPLFAMLCLTTILMVLPDFTLRKFLLATPVFILALLSKETSVVAPALIVVCIFYLSEKPWRLRQYFCTWPLWLVAIIFLAWRMTDINFDGPRRYALLYHLPEYVNLRMYSEHFSYRVYTFLATLPTYASLLLWPVGLHMERNFMIFSDFWKPETLIGFLMFGGAAFYLVAHRQSKDKTMAWGLLWFAAAHAPDTGLFVIGNSLLLEHWMYLPTVGLFLGISETVVIIIERVQVKSLKTAALVVCIAIAGTLTVLTHAQNLVWQDAITFYENIFKYGELSARSHNNVALAYINRGEVDKGIGEFYKAIAMTDSYAETQHNLGLAYLQLPNPQSHMDEAIAHLKRALEIDPHFYRSDIALAQIYLASGDKEKAAYYDAKAQQEFNYMRQ